jgi:hypothetical protein
MRIGPHEWLVEAFRRVATPAVRAGYGRKGSGRLLLALLVAAVLTGSFALGTSPAVAAPTTAGTGASHVYDTPGGARFDLHETENADVSPAQRSVPREKSAVEGRATSTIPLARSNATNTVNLNTGNVSVYTSTNLAGNINYVGITNNVARRGAERLAEKGITINEIPGLTSLSRADARAVEQVLIEANGGPGGGQLLNKINSIAVSNPAYASSIERGCHLLSAVSYSVPSGVCQ